MGIKITDDRDTWDKIIRELNRLINSKLILRIDPNATYSSGVKVEDVGMWMEFGWDEFNVHYPSRPFWRSAFDSNIDKINTKFESELNKILAGKGTAKQLLENLGKFVVLRIKEMILKGTYETLAISTQQKKGSSKPLVDTRKLYNSIQYEVEVI